MWKKLYLATLLAAIAVLIGLAQVQADPDTNDTRLLSQPAISAKNIAFIYSEDLWVADQDGKNPKRLTSDIGVESNPVFSPDGQTIAFSAQYDGNTDVYTIPVTGGTPTRLTWHPGPDTVRGFTPDGKVLFSSNRNVYSNRHQQLFTVDLKGGMPTQLPIPWGFEACYSPDGEYIAYTPVRDATLQWKHYRGGTHSRIWIYHNKDHETVEISQPKDRCNDLDPQWIGNTIYFRSDRNGEYNIFSYDVGTKEIKQLTQFKDFPVLDINSGGGKIIFEQAGYLHTMTPGQTGTTKLTIGVATDCPEARARFVKGSKYVRAASISPSGARAVVEFRGEIITVPAEKGDPRNITNSPDVHDRDPSWSPDGKLIGYFSDASGEYELVLAPQNGKGETKKLKLNGSGFYSNLTWSRDSKKVLFTDNSQSLYFLEIDSGKQTKIVEPKYGLSRGVKVSNWSPDSKWVCYAIDTPSHISQVFAYSLDENKSHPITDGLSEATEPVFDASGKYLYFLSSNDTGMSKHSFSQSSADSRPPRWSVNLVTLRKETASPFLKESDEEKGSSDSPRRSPPERKPDDEADKGDKDKAGKDNKDGADGNKENAEAPRERPRGMGRAAEKKEPFKIDFAGIDQRIISFPVSSGSFGNLQAGAANQIFYISRGSGDDGPARGGRGGGGFGGALHRYDLDKRKDDTVQPVCMNYVLTPDGKKMLYSVGPGNWHIGSTSGGGGAAPTGAAPAFAGRGGRPGRNPGGGGAPPSDSASESDGSGRLNLDAIEVRMDPRAEWKQIFNEAWRINRDYFYDPYMHGADWPAIKAKYEVFLPHCTNSGDLYRVIRWMLSELAVGHSYMTPGERLYEHKTVPGGLLGADYEIADGRYRFKKIYGGLNWTSDLRSPLTAPGVDVKEGEYLLAVKGVDLKPPTEIYSLFENTAGKSIEITVGPTADGKNSRTVTIEPIANELALRNREWIEGNLHKVARATNGRVGYVYLPDTAAQGLSYFKRYFFPQVEKEALIVDERFNSGGQIADYYIDILRRPFTSYWAPRYGADWRSPSAAVHGPKVMIIDEGAGSGGDMLPWMFRKYQLGPLVGKRTWGGLVGIGGYPVLMDGGNVTAPGFAIWTPEEGFTVENQGVPPDYDIDIWPKDVIAGKDPQLEKAIELVMKDLEKNPKKVDQRPAYPRRAVNNNGKDGN
jgi:tricorn protease